MRLKQGTAHHSGYSGKDARLSLIDRPGRRALEARLAGKKFAQQDVVRMPKGQAVDLELEGADKIFAVLVEFGDEQYPDPRFQGPPPDGSTTDVTGPVHNEIAPPDRSIDNSTLWQPDYDRDGIGDAPTDMGAWERLMLGWREPQGSQSTSSCSTVSGRSCSSAPTSRCRRSRPRWSSSCLRTSATWDRSTPAISCSEAAPATCSRTP